MISSATVQPARIQSMTRLPTTATLPQTAIQPVFFTTRGDTVTYKMWEVSDSENVADGHFETKTVSLSNLEKDYYVTQSQKDEVNSYVSQLRSEADYLNQNQ